jgi:outer membrane protein TolC
MKPVCLYSVALVGLLAVSAMAPLARAEDAPLMRGTSADDFAGVIDAGNNVAKSDVDAPAFLKRKLKTAAKVEARVEAGAKIKLKRSEAVAKKVAVKVAPKIAKREPAQILVKEISLEVSPKQLASLKQHLTPRERQISEEAVNVPLAAQVATAVQVVPIGNDQSDIYTANTLKAVEPTDDLYTGSLPDAQEPQDALYDSDYPANFDGGNVTDIASAANLARENSNLVKAFEEDARAAEAGVNKEKAGFAPTVTSTLATNYQQDADTGRGPDNYGELSFNWPLYTGGQRRHAVKSAEATYDAAVARRDATEGRVIGETVDAYLRYVYASRIVALLKESEAGTQRVLSSVNAQREGGFASGPDVQAVKVQLANVRTQVADAETNLSKARDDVTLLAGRPVQPHVDVSRIERALAPGRDALLKKALENNPRILAATKDYESATEVAQAKSGRALPQVAASGNYRYDLDRSVSGTREEWNIGARLSLPLLDLATRQDTKQSMHAANASYYRALETKRVITNEFNTQWVDYLGALRELEQAEARISEQRKTVAATKARFDEGDGSLSEYLRTLADLKASQVSMEQNQARHVSNMARLLLTVGDFETVFPAK